MCLCVFNVFLWISYFSIKIRGHLKPIGCECGRNFPPTSTGVGVIFHPVAFWGEVGRVVNPPFDDGTGGWTFLKLNASEAVQGKEGVPIPIPIPVDFHDDIGVGGVKLEWQILQFLQVSCSSLSKIHEIHRQSLQYVKIDQSTN
jgi:hypothetical protein